MKDFRKAIVACFGNPDAEYSDEQLVEMVADAVGTPCTTDKYMYLADAVQDKALSLLVAIRRDAPINEIRERAEVMDLACRNYACGPQPD